LGGQVAQQVAIEVVGPLLAAFVADGTDRSRCLQLDQLLHAVAGQLRDQLTPGAHAIQ
jgi:hypothetical protein